MTIEILTEALQALNIPGSRASGFAWLKENFVRLAADEADSAAERIGQNAHERIFFSDDVPDIQDFFDVAINHPDATVRGTVMISHLAVAKKCMGKEHVGRALALCEKARDQNLRCMEPVDAVVVMLERFSPFEAKDAVDLLRLTDKYMRGRDYERNHVGKILVIHARHDQPTVASFLRSYLNDDNQVIKEHSIRIMADMAKGFYEAKDMDGLAKLFGAEAVPSAPPMVPFPFPASSRSAEPSEWPHNLNEGPPLAS